MDEPMTKQQADALLRGVHVVIDLLENHTALLTEIKAELTKPVPPSPVPEILRLLLTEVQKGHAKSDAIESKVDRIEQRLNLAAGIQ